MKMARVFPGTTPQPVEGRPVSAVWSTAHACIQVYLEEGRVHEVLALDGNWANSPDPGYRFIATVARYGWLVTPNRVTIITMSGTQEVSAGSNVVELGDQVFHIYARQGRTSVSPG